MLYAELGRLHHHSFRPVLASQIPVGLLYHRKVLLEPLRPD
jgi:hypothetical protein